MLILQLGSLEAAQVLEDGLEVDGKRQVQVVLVLVQEELEEGAEHGADLVVELEELLRGVLVMLGVLRF